MLQCLGPAVIWSCSVIVIVVKCSVSKCCAVLKCIGVYAMSVTYLQTYLQTYRATIRGPIGPKNQKTLENHLDFMIFILFILVNLFFLEEFCYVC